MLVNGQMNHAVCHMARIITKEDKRDDDED